MLADPRTIRPERRSSSGRTTPPRQPRAPAPAPCRRRSRHPRRHPATDRLAASADGARRPGPTSGRCSRPTGRRARQGPRYAPSSGHRDCGGCAGAQPGRLRRRMAPTRSRRLHGRGHAVCRARPGKHRRTDGRRPRAASAPHRPHPGHPRPAARAGARRCGPLPQRPRAPCAGASPRPQRLRAEPARTHTAPPGGQQLRGTRPGRPRVRTRPDDLGRGIGAATPGHRRGVVSTPSPSSAGLSRRPWPGR